MTARFNTGRLFFALLPDVNTTSAIDFHQAQISPEGGTKVKPENYHITLLFLGKVESKIIDALCLDCDNLVQSTFNLVINKADWWPKQKLFWLGPKIVPPELENLVRSIRTIAARRKLVVDKPNFMPHITLMRKVLAAPQHPIMRPFTWVAHDFCLMQSITYPEGVQYRELSRWPLES